MVNLDRRKSPIKFKRFEDKAVEVFALKNLENLLKENKMLYELIEQIFKYGYLNTNKELHSQIEKVLYSEKLRKLEERSGTNRKS